MKTIKLIDNIAPGNEKRLSPDEPEAVEFIASRGLFRAGHYTTSGCHGFGLTREEATLGYKNDVAQEKRCEFTPGHEWHGDRQVEIGIKPLPPEAEFP